MRTPVFLLIAGVALGQTVDERFASKEPWDLAWGARMAGDAGQAEFAPRIIGLLGHADWQVRMAAFDALIHLRADVDDATLAPLAKEHFDPVMVIAWQHLPQHKDLLLRLWGENSQTSFDRQWAVIVRLLREWKWEVPFYVTDPGKKHGAGIGMSLSCGDGSHDARYPLVRVYNLHTGRLTGSQTPMVAGPHPVSYGQDSCQPAESITRGSWTLDFLKDLATFTAEVPEGQTEFRGKGQYSRDVEAFLKRLKTYAADLRKALIRSGKLVASENVEPSIQLRVVDQRSSRTMALPSVAGVVE
jgi:hypothetical protein